MLLLLLVFASFVSEKPIGKMLLELSNSSSLLWVYPAAAGVHKVTLNYNESAEKHGCGSAEPWL